MGGGGKREGLHGPECMMLRFDNDDELDTLCQNTFGYEYF